MPTADDALNLVKTFNWWVFPCQQWDRPTNAEPKKRGKAPLIDSGYKGATQDEATIRRWWSQFPNANIGVACGASGILVMDIDGIEGWRQIEHGGHELPETLTSVTGRPDGKQLILKANGLRNRTGLFGAPGVDLRGDGGYIIAPTSKHWSGKLYEFEDPDVPIAEPPLWLAGLQQQQAGRLAAARSLGPDDMLGEGQRNDGLYAIGCVYRRDKGIQDPVVMYGILQTENERRCSPPLAEDEVRKIAASAVKLLPDEIEQPYEGFWDQAVKYAESTGDVNVVKKMQSAITDVTAKAPEATQGHLRLELIRYVADGVSGGTFAVTVHYAGKTAFLMGVTDTDLDSPARIRAKCLGERLRIPTLKRGAWNSLLDLALAECTDVEVTREQSPAGACIEAIYDFVESRAPTEDWKSFPESGERSRFVHEDGTSSVHSTSLRKYIQQTVRDAKRNDITAAMKAVSAIHHRSPGGRARMVRIPPQDACDEIPR